MNHNLILYRTILRLYTNYELDENRRTTILRNNDILTDYMSIEASIDNEFLKYGIKRYQTGVESTFGEEISIKLEVIFIFTRRFFIVPNEIMVTLKNYLIMHGRTPPEFNPQKIFLGIAGRVFDPLTNVRFIGEGLQTEDGIIIDFLAFLELPHDWLHMRVIHELLHVLGIEEHEMPTYIRDAYSVTYDISRPFVKKIHEQAPYVYQKFLEIENAFFLNNRTLANQLVDLGHRLHSSGFPAPLNEILYADSYGPATLFPLDIQPFKILLM